MLVIVAILAAVRFWPTKKDPKVEAMIAGAISAAIGLSEGEEIEINVPPMSADEFLVAQWVVHPPLEEDNLPEHIHRRLTSDADSNASHQINLYHYRGQELLSRTRISDCIFFSSYKPLIITAEARKIRLQCQKMPNCEYQRREKTQCDMQVISVN